MANRFSVFADAFMKALRYVGNDLNESAMFQRLGPNWREDQEYQRATRSSDLRTREMSEAKGRLTLADQLSNLIGTASMGEASRAGDVQRAEEPLIFGAEEGGRGYAANVPMAETVTPDPADVVPDDLGELTGFDRAALVRLGLGKARQDKRALAELRGEQTLSAIDARGALTAGRDARRQSFQRDMEEFKHGNRLDLTELGAKLRQRLAEYNQGQQNSRFREGLDSSETRFYDRLNETERQWEAERDLRVISARRQVLQAELDRDANLSTEGRAQIVFELGLLNGRLSQMGLKPSVVVPQAQPGVPGPPDSESSVVPNSGPPPPAGDVIPPWVAAIVRKGSAATPAERQRVAAWRASVGR